MGIRLRGINRSGRAVTDRRVSRNKVITTRNWIIMYDKAITSLFRRWLRIFLRYWKFVYGCSGCGVVGWSKVSGGSKYVLMPQQILYDFEVRPGSQECCREASPSTSNALWMHSRSPTYTVPPISYASCVLSISFKDSSIRGLL